MKGRHLHSNQDAPYGSCFLARAPSHRQPGLRSARLGTSPELQAGPGRASGRVVLLTVTMFHTRTVRLSGVVIHWHVVPVDTSIFLAR